jgi:putative transposase
MSAQSNTICVSQLDSILLTAQAFGKRLGKSEGWVFGMINRGEINTEPARKGKRKLIRIPARQLSKFSPEAHREWISEQGQEDQHQEPPEQVAKVGPHLKNYGVEPDSLPPGVSISTAERRPRFMLDQLSEDKRREVLEWDDWLAKVRTLCTAERKREAKERGRSYRTIQRLLRDWNKRNIDAIIVFLYRAVRADAGVKRQPMLFASEAMKEHIELLLCRYTPEKARKELRGLAKHLKVRLPSLSSLCVWQKKLRETDPGKVDFYKLNPKAWDDAYGSYISRLKPHWPNEVWTLDSHTLDILVFNPRKNKFERAWLIAIRDETTNRIVGFRLTFQPNADEIALVLMDAIAREGRPESIYIDRGLDYNATFIKLACRALGIRDIRALPYNAKAKPIEPVFGIIERQCICFLPGFVGSSSKQKEKIPETEPKLTLEEVWREVELWRVGYHEESSDALEEKRSPRQALEASKRKGWGPIVVDEQKLSLAFTISEERVIGRIGVEFEGACYRHDELDGKAGRKVKMRAAITDYSKIFVELDGQWLTAQRTEKAAFGVDADRSHIRQARQLKSRTRRKIKDALQGLEVASAPVRELADKLAAEERLFKEQQIEQASSQRAESNVRLFVPADLTKMKSDLQRDGKRIRMEQVSDKHGVPLNWSVRKKFTAYRELGVEFPIEYLKPDVPLELQLSPEEIEQLPEHIRDDYKRRGLYVDEETLKEISALASEKTRQERQERRRKLVGL